MKIKGKLAGQLGALLLLILCAMALPTYACAKDYPAEYPDTGLTVTVTVPDEAVIPSNYVLYVRKIQEGEDKYPSEAEIQEKIGKVAETNGLFCYDFHWKNKDTDEVVEDFSVFKDSKLPPEKQKLTVNVKFKDEAHQLYGEPASRKLLVMNVDDEKKLQEATITSVERNPKGYKEFTFEATTKGPYVFASKMVYEGYINDVKIKTLLDGTEDFDQELDQDEGNRLVRTNDSIKYTLELNMQPRDTAVKRKSGRICFEMTMENDITAAEFSTEGDMKWLEEDYKIEYLAGDDVLYTRNSKNELHDKDGKKISEEKFKNEIAAASDSLAGANSYRTGITKQRLTGSFEVVSSEGNDSILSMNKDCSVGIRVLDAKNDEKIQPVFRFWFEGNEQNWGSEKNLDNKPVAVQSVTANRLDTSTTDAVTVKSAARFNLQLLKNADMGYKGWFDLSTGNEIKDKSVVARLDQLSALKWNQGVANPAEFKDESGNQVSYPNYKNYRYGRITSYGITLQMYDPGKKESQGIRPACGSYHLRPPSVLQRHEAGGVG